VRGPGGNPRAYSTKIKQAKAETNSALSV
jgi:hypothetical protein